MRLGIGSYALPWSVAGLGHFGLLSRAIDLGVQAVQFCDNLPLEVLTTEELDRLFGLAADAGVVVEPGARGLDLSILRRLIVLAVRGGSGFVRVVMGPEGERALELLRPLASGLRDGGVRLAIENHDHLPARDLAQLVETLGTDAFGVCLDTANSLGCLEGTEHVVNVLGPYTVNLHLKDVRIDRLDHKLGFLVTGTAAGEGALDVPWIITQALHVESVTLECWPNPAPDGMPPLEMEGAMLDRSVRYAKQILRAQGFSDLI